MTFCEENSLTELPASAHDLASCVAKVASETRSVSAAETLASSVAYEHRRRFLPSPTAHDSFRMLMQSVRKNLAQPRQPAEPFTPMMIRRFLDHLYAPAHGRDGLLADLCLWRTVWRVAMEFYCLGRFSDVCALRRSDVRFEQKPQLHLVVHFEGGKNDQVETASP